MQLSDFLTTVSDLSHADALAAARLHGEIEGALIPATTINQLAAALDLTGVIVDVAADQHHPARHKMLSVQLSIQGGHDFNFIAGTAAGDGNLAMLDWLIAGQMSEHTAQLEQFRQAAYNLANKQSRPFVNVTLHDVLVARDACPQLNISVSGGYITVNQSAQTERHLARITATNPRTGSREVLGRLWLHSAGVYDYRLPSHYSGSTDLQIDNAYGALSWPSAE